MREEALEAALATLASIMEPSFPLSTGKHRKTGTETTEQRETPLTPKAMGSGAVPRTIRLRPLTRRAPHTREPEEVRVEQDMEEEGELQNTVDPNPLSTKTNLPLVFVVTRTWAERNRDGP